MSGKNKMSSHVPGYVDELYPNASDDMLEHCRQYVEESVQSAESEDEFAVMSAYIDQGHTITEWFLLKDNIDAYIEFLESLIED